MKKIIQLIFLLLLISVFAQAANYDYLIVTTSKYTDAANRLKDWEASRGYNPYVMYLTSKYGDTALNKIREFYSQNKNVKFLIIIGNDTDLRPITISPRKYLEETETADAFLQNNYRYRGIGVVNGVRKKIYDMYGTSFDTPVDWSAGIPIMTDNEFARNTTWTHNNSNSIPRGRISARTAKEAEDIIDKIIRYEWMPPTNLNCYSKALHMTLFVDGENNDGVNGANWFWPTEEITRNALSKGIDVNRIYYADYMNEEMNITANPMKYSSSGYLPRNFQGRCYFWEQGPENIVDAVNDGIMYAMYNGGHGQVYGYTPTTWNHYQRFVNIDPKNPDAKTVASLTNVNAPTFFYNFNCWTATFVGNGDTTNNNYPRNKACADYHEIGKCTKELLNDGCMCENLLRMPGGAVGAFGFAQVGWSDFNGSTAKNVMSNLIDVTSTKSVGEHLFSINYNDWHNIVSMYFGDPSSHMFTVVPKSFNPEITKSGTTVTVKTKVDNCTVTLTNLLTDATTIKNDCSIATFTDVNYPYTVTIKKHNYITYTGPETLYIQNRTFNRAKDVYGNKDIVAGNNVSSSYTQGNVTNSGSKVRFIARNKVSLKSGFSVKNNGKFTATVTHYTAPTGSTRKSVISGEDEFELAEEKVMEQSEEQRFDIYPNPTDGPFTISLSAIEGPYEIEIIDIMGRVIYTKSDNKKEVNVDLSGKGSGIYHVRVYTGNKVWSSQVLIK